MRSRPWLWLLLGACSSESGLFGDKDKGAVSSVSETTLSVPKGGPVPLDVECANTCPTVPAWDTVKEWEVVVTEHGGNFALPVIAHLDDEDGDGIIGSSGDNPDVMLQYSQFVDNTQVGGLGVWRGDGSGQIASYELPLHVLPHASAVGDLDGDGTSEIVVVTGDYVDAQLTALSPDGTVWWTSESFSLSGPSGTYIGACQPLIVDLEGDGATEVFCDVILVEGVTGETRHRLPFDERVYWATNTIVDLDRDGVAEIVSGNKVRDADGELLWAAPEPEMGGWSTYPAAVQLDSDDSAEVVFASDGSLLAFDTDGEPLWSTPVHPEEAAASPPCAANFDGDEEIEIAVAFRSTMAAFDPDGSILWTRPVQDDSTAASCTAFDFDLDGRAEIAYADEDKFSLYCGADGKSLYEDSSHDSGTGYEYPIVVDLDGDGAAEVVVGWSRGLHEPLGFTVYGQHDGLWPGAGQIWPQSDFLPDGEVAHAQQALGAESPYDPEERVNLGLVVDQQGDCEGLSLSVQVQNTGPGDGAAGRILEIRALDVAVLGETQTRLVHEIELPAIPSATALPAMRLDLSAEEIGSIGVQLAILPDPGVRECDAGNEFIQIFMECGP